MPTRCACPLQYRLHVGRRTGRRGLLQAAHVLHSCTRGELRSSPPSPASFHVSLCPLHRLALHSAIRSKAAHPLQHRMFDRLLLLLLPLWHRGVSRCCCCCCCCGDQSAASSGRCGREDLPPPREAKMPVHWMLRVLIHLVQVGHGRPFNTALRVSKPPVTAATCSTVVITNIQAPGKRCLVIDD